MNKILIVSDSHGLTSELTKIKQRHQVNYLIHCGDSELLKDAVQLEDFITVKGNCDWQSDFPLEEIVEFGGLRLLVTHGHLYHVKSTLLNIQDRAKEVEADVVCFGHSHIAYSEKIDNQLFINPGSIRMPRKFSEPSYIMMQWDEPNQVTVNFYHAADGQVISLPYDQQYEFI